MNVTSPTPAHTACGTSLRKHAIAGAMSGHIQAPAQITPVARSFTTRGIAMAPILTHAPITRPGPRGR
jgi:hypothetical protein